ncbi:MAG: glycosyltransferase family 2 protein [Chitinophagales bacterium]|nr:glycosyltransferase family 2 protein [Chitinophagales bacterium]
MKLSIVSPVYRAENIVDELVRRVVDEVQKITLDFELILVEDGSPDNSWDAIERNCIIDKRVKGIKLSRNFGQHYAITAGLDNAKGDYIIIMDCDLQDNPNSIRLLIDKLNEGFDIVFTKRKKRNHTLFKKITAKLYNYMIGILADKKFDVEMGSMIAIQQNAANAFLGLKDKDRLYIQMFKWIGFKQTNITVEHDKRFEGESTYTLVKLITLALQGLISHSNKLLKLSILFGIIISFLSFLIVIIIIIAYFVQGFSPGWPSIFIGISFATGIILLSNGILGIYIGKIFEQVKDRPLFIVESKLNLEQ